MIKVTNPRAQDATQMVDVLHNNHEVACLNTTFHQNWNKKLQQQK